MNKKNLVPILFCMPPFTSIFVSHFILKFIYLELKVGLFTLDSKKHEEDEVSLNRLYDLFPLFLFGVILALLMWNVFPQNSFMNVSTQLVQSLLIGFSNALNSTIHIT